MFTKHSPSETLMVRHYYTRKEKTVFKLKFCWWIVSKVSKSEEKIEVIS